VNGVSYFDAVFISQTALVISIHAQYYAFLYGDSRASREVSHFQDAGSLVEACFPFLPDYS
jgi:hypothetical protein